MMSRRVLSSASLSARIDRASCLRRSSSKESQPCTKMPHTREKWFPLLKWQARLSSFLRILLVPVRLWILTSSLCSHPHLSSPNCHSSIKSGDSFLGQGCVLRIRSGSLTCMMYARATSLQSTSLKAIFQPCPAISCSPPFLSFSNQSTSSFCHVFLCSCSCGLRHYQQRSTSILCGRYS